MIIKISKESERYVSMTRKYNNTPRGKVTSKNKEIKSTIKLKLSLPL